MSVQAPCRRRLDVAALALLLLGLACGALAYWLITEHWVNPLILAPSVAAAPVHMPNRAPALCQ